MRVLHIIVFLFNFKQWENINLVWPRVKDSNNFEGPNKTFFHLQ